MQFSPLSTVRDRIRVGRPLPFNVRDADRTLLLARGQVIATRDQLVTLFRRGALVDIAELQRPEDRIRHAPKEELPQLWIASLDQLGQTLRASCDTGFVDALDAAAPPVIALVERDRDLAIFQVLRQRGGAFVDYGVNHSLRTAITAYLVAQRAGWNPAESLCAFKAALTMNLAMLELHGQLAAQAAPPTAAQHEAILAHPDEGVRLLELAGVDDRDWLSAVAQHHELRDGTGYPRRLRDVHPTAELVRLADTYITKLSPQATRGAIAADAAGRMMFMQDPGHPMVAALVKEFGVYPPGAFVRLASGELGIVVQRGPTVTTPVVAVLTSAGGHDLNEPLHRDTGEPGYAITGIVDDRGRAATCDPSALMALAA